MTVLTPSKRRPFRVEHEGRFVVFSRHAVKRCEEREIDPLMLATRIMAAPHPGKRGKARRFRGTDGLRAIARPSDRVWTVITTWQE